MKRPTRFTVLFILALLYLISPIDLLPDAAGIIGRIDDILLLLYVYYRYRVWKKAAAADQAKTPEEASPKAFDPYEVLGVSRTASEEEIRSAYKQLAHQYHPDRVAHLGAELKVLAHEKMLEIQKAYETLVNR